MIKNIQKITSIKYYAKCKNYCPMGKDWYTNNFYLYLEPNENLPDYCEIDDFINKEIKGKNLIIEEAINILFNYILEQYKPNKIIIESNVKDAAHNEVVIRKEI